MDSALLQVKIEPNSQETPCQYGLENFCFAKREKSVPTTHNYNKQTALSHERKKGRAHNRWCRGVGLGTTKLFPFSIGPIKEKN